MESQSLIKLKILGFKKPECSGPAAATITAFINPAAYDRKLQILYAGEQVGGTSATTQRFTGMGTLELDLNFFVDGTGVVKLPAGFTSVDEYVDKFSSIVAGYQGEIHRPYYLFIIWGQLKFIGVCKKLDVKYQLFSPTGKALRATIDITLVQTIDYKTKAAEAKKSSPDLTHLRVVNAGDTLPLMAYRIYGDSSYYMEVARANNLASFMDIKPGDQIYFPPIKK